MRTLREQETLFDRQLATEMAVENARKAWADADANYRDALIKIDKTKLVAPIGGALSERADITQGTLVNERTSIAKIMDYSQVFVDLKIPNAQIIHVKLGQRVRVSNYALPDAVFEGEIAEMDPALDPTTRTVKVGGMVNNPDLLLRAGHVCQSGNRHGVAPKRRSHMRATWFCGDAIKRSFLSKRKGRAQQREVETGLEDRDRVEIAVGLEPGEQLITSNYETLRPRTRWRSRETGDEFAGIFNALSGHRCDGYPRGGCSDGFPSRAWARISCPICKRLSSPST